MTDASIYKHLQPSNYKIMCEFIDNIARFKLLVPVGKRRISKPMNSTSVDLSLVRN